MRSYFLISIITLLMISGCEKNRSHSYADPLYPTVFEKLGPSAADEMRAAFHQDNSYVHSSINDFGFCDYYDDSYEPQDPPADSAVTFQEAVNIAKSFIAANKQFTGVNDTGDLYFIKTRELPRSWDNSQGWYLTSAFQKADTIDVLTHVYIRTRGKSVYSCVGNWYPEVYIPGKINFSLEKAKASLIGMSLTHYGWGGPYTVTVTREALYESSTGIYVVPVNYDDRIELHVAWYINIPGPVWYEIYVDVMTGDIVRESPTIIAK